MARSRRLNQLLSRILFLETNILPPQKIAGNYTQKESDLVRSFILLVHAEIEAYLEDVAREKVDDSLRKWMHTRKKSTCLKSILAFVGNDLRYEGQEKVEANNISYRMNKTVAH